MGRQVHPSEVATALRSVGPSRKPMKRTSTGLRNTETRFRELLRSCLLGLLLHPEAIFRLKETHRNRLIRQLTALVTSLEQIILALEAVSRPTAPGASWAVLSETKRFLEKVKTQGNSPLALEGAQSTALAAAQILKKNFLGELPTVEEGRRILSEEQKSLLQKVQVLLEGLEYLISSPSADLAAMKAELLPSLAQDLADQVEEALYQVSEGTILQEPGARIAELVAVPSTIKAVTRARDPMKPLVQAKDRTLDDEGPYPSGSSLEVQAAAPVTPAFVKGTRTPGDFPDDATFLYTPNGLTERTVTLIGANKYRIVSRALEDTAYNITADRLLLSFNDVLYSLALTVGSRTPTEIKTELEAAALAINRDLEVAFSAGRMYLVSTERVALSQGGLTPTELLLETTLDLVFPVAVLAGLDLDVEVGPAGGPIVRTHTFGAGPFNDMADVINDLEADAPFATDMQFLGNGDKLTMEYTAPEYASIQVIAQPAGLTFDLDEYIMGAEAVSGSAATDLGFDPVQPTETLYRSNHIVELIQEQELTDPQISARFDTDTVTTGTGTVSGVRLTDPSKDFVGSGVRIGDLCILEGQGLLTVDALAPTWLDLSGGAPPGLKLSYEVVSERITLESLSTELTSGIVIGAGTANTGLGIVGTGVVAAVPTFQVVGRLEGETAGRTISNEVLGIPDDAVVSIADSTIRSAALVQFHTLSKALRSVKRHKYFSYLQNFDRVLEDVEEASRLEALRSRRIQSAQKKLLSLLLLLDSNPPNYDKVLLSLQRTGTRAPAVPSTSLKQSLTSYVPKVGKEEASVADETVRGFRDHGYDRAADFLLETRFGELLDMTGETGSSAGRVTSAMSAVAQRLSTRTSRSR